MSKVSDVVFTVYNDEWEDFAKNHTYNPFVKCAKVTKYPTTNLVNVSWDFVKWYTKDEFIDEIIDYFNERDYLLTTLDEDNTLYQQDHVKSDDDVSEFWDYAPQVKLVL